MAVDQMPTSVENNENLNSLNNAVEESDKGILTLDESLSVLNKAKINLGDLEGLPGISAEEFRSHIFNLVAMGKLKLDQPFHELNLYSIINPKHFDEGSGFNFKGSNEIMIGEGMIQFADLGEFGERVLRELKLKSLFGDQVSKKRFNIQAFEDFEGNTYARWETFLRGLMEKGELDFNPYDFHSCGLEPVVDETTGELRGINFVTHKLDGADFVSLKHTFSEQGLSLGSGLGADLKRQWSQRMKDGQPESLPGYDVWGVMK